MFPFGMFSAEQPLCSNVYQGALCFTGSNRRHLPPPVAGTVWCPAGSMRSLGGHSTAGAGTGLGFVGDRS